MIPIRLKKGKEGPLLEGFPWVYGDELIESSEQMLVPPGSLVSIENHKGQRLATGYFNPRSIIACRVLTLGTEKIGTDFFKTRLAKALARREPIGVPFYRLSHGEAEGLPGLLIDRFDDAYVIQVGTAGMELLQPLWLAALEELLAPRIIILRGDIASRKLEGLSQEVKIIRSPLEEGDQVGGSQKYTEYAPSLTLPLNGEGIIQLYENGCTYFADLLQGQKTGWFYDQRDNRKMIADLAKDKTVLDVYSHSGGFGILAAKRGAAQVTMVDSSKLALSLAEQSAAENNVDSVCETMQGDALEIMQRLHKEGKSYDIVLADPPAFVKNRKDIVAGMKGYEKVARAAAALVKPDGLLFVASCSHHASRGAFNNAVVSGAKKAGKTAAILKQTGAGPDHPKHPKLPQSEYLKGLLLKID